MFLPGPAPEPLFAAQSLINTWYGLLAGGGHEWLATRGDLARWCHAQAVDLAEGDVDDADVALAHVVREGLRAVLAPHNDAVRDEDAAALAALEDASTELPLRFTVHGPTLMPGSDGARGVLATALIGLVTAVPSRRARLKVCRDGRCRTSFYDTSRNGSGVWCSMAECGVANKQAAYIERRRARNAASRV